MISPVPVGVSEHSDHNCGLNKFVGLCGTYNTFEIHKLHSWSLSSVTLTDIVPCPLTFTLPPISFEINAFSFSYPINE